MALLPDHWRSPATLKDATQVQREMAGAVEMVDRIGRVGLVAGADTSMKWRDSRGPVHAAIAPSHWPSGDMLPAGTATLVPTIPYVPGYLGFREAPALVAAWEGLEVKPDLLFVDGHGYAHPRRAGIASQIGLLLDVPTIGCGKSLLCGEIEGELGPSPGDRLPVVDRGEVVAIALRTRARCRPIYVSIGHRVSLETAVEWVSKLAAGRRLPLPIRMAHDAANDARRARLVIPGEAQS